MKNLSICVLLLYLTVSNVSMAIPARQVRQFFTQPNGYQLTVVLQGDEFYSFHSTTDGLMLLKDYDGYMKYAVTDSNAKLIPGKYVAQNPENRNAEVETYIKSIDQTLINGAYQKQKRENGIIKLPQTIGSSEFPNKGEVKSIIIMAQFQDQKFSDIGTREEFTKMMNEAGYSNYRATGSARDYFIDQSQGLFTPTFDVYGPVTLPQKMVYYGERTDFAIDKNPSQMAVDACMLARKDFNVDFSQYDYDNDGFVDLVYIIYAGYSEAQGAPSYTIWPRAGTISKDGKSLSLDGKSIDSYACSAELGGYTGKEIDGIGSFCHEFSHCLGLPDFYDSRNMGGYGLGYWSIMDLGCYNNNIKTPPSYSAFERYSVSWYEPEYLNTPEQDITLEDFSKSNKAYFIKSDASENEYYTIENRQSEGWDKYLPGHGLMITHINYDPQSWANNTVNTSKGKEKVQIVPADGDLSITTNKGDAFPGPVCNTSFTDVSKPGATLFTGGYLGKPITNIREKDGIITFNFMGDICLPPDLKEAGKITQTGFTAEWTEVKGADSYTLEVAPQTVGQTLIAEDFTGFKSGNQEQPDTDDISDRLDQYTQAQGWSGYEISQAGGMCALGVSSGFGCLLTPELEFCNNKSFTFCLELTAPQASPAELQLGVFKNPNEIKPTASKNISIQNSAEKIYWTFFTTETTGYMKIQTNTAVYISSVALYSGDVKTQLENNTLPAFEVTEQKQTISGITAISYEVTGLKPASNYIYNVRTTIADEASNPSSKAQITTLTDTGIDSTASKDRIYVSGNQIIINAQSGELVRIYTADGVEKSSFYAREGENRVWADNGIYIIRTGNVSVKAIVVKQ